MKCVASFACFSLLVVFVCAAPAPQLGGSFSASVQAGTSPSASPIGGLTNILQNIDLPGLLRGINSFVGLIRQFCPPLSQILDNVIQNVTSQAFRIFGRAILQNGGLGGGAGGTQKVNVVLPTFPPDEDYDEDEEEESGPVTVDLDTRAGKPSQETTTSSASADDNTVAKRHVRVVREAETDQELAESAPEPQEDLSNVDTESDSDRGKRFLPFGGDGHGGGSGNFLFDVIRNTADMTGRAMGTLYRIVAGTQSFGFSFNNTNSRQLVAGSGATEDGTDSGHAGVGGVAEIDIAKGADGYTEGIPGPITRLFVIANRGIANLVQDLILRLAQTSERLVNFKARLITALI
ncbi:uncharacterized protein LOC123684918 isoform X1 [Harmonia axyridis]|uniref:uncharacterized protein LOC123684918 isoform X1 n=1 Tax=Harmonia axyridis TaxID=115357 RepID=UPI001E27970B|nr:uncharacterized protein LOC123684918 isoform X1 [Harmonia axyridis]XP_045480386.1 uncharacterized protein LOC123684918 isoform X1 [Harmonia axyridis]XP_045480388.1 uncharacterized protein LOC123684918 isoform X1 [Harmonia axyridis]XP_045480389.1 uncharacterized protein LOC123684918 isoform X1 [Harmonia axyridis]XP_045480390.1 uncharacterized protein LOC123684918 isoform X1 [Harmonia axyridis]XP_045480391.1 uncharacterized protein LOC123684918 isoform X1 [Harmonia axyridis]